jgi:hypothetical protein
MQERKSRVEKQSQKQCYNQPPLPPPSILCLFCGLDRLVVFDPPPRGGHSESNCGCDTGRGSGIYAGSTADRIPDAKPEPLRLRARPLCGLYVLRPIAEPAPNAISYGTCSGGGAGCNEDDGRGGRCSGGARVKCGAALCVGLCLG